MALVSLREVSIAFGGPAILDSVSLSIEKGERSCVTGRNGEGKSTLLKILAGVIEPDDGDVIREKGCRIAYVGQEVSATEEGLSGGQLKRRQLEEALLQQPDLLLLDEPTRGVDVGAKAEIYEIMNELTKQGVSIIMISSELPEIINMADRVYVMYDGRITGCIDYEDVSQEAIMKLATLETAGGVKA